jgi:hypothetical protein
MMRTLILAAFLLIIAANTQPAFASIYSVGWEDGLNDGYYGCHLCSATPEEQKSTDYMAGYSEGYNQGTRQKAQDDADQKQKEQENKAFREKYGFDKKYAELAGLALLLLVVGLLGLMSPEER